MIVNIDINTLSEIVNTNSTVLKSKGPESVQTKGEAQELYLVIFSKIV